MKLRIGTFILVCLAGLHSLRGAVTLDLIASAPTVMPGDTVTLDLVIAGLGNPPSVGSFDLDIGYDAAVVTPASVMFGLLLGDPALFEAITDVKNSSGVINVAEVSLLDAAALHALQSASFSLATISFTALGTGVPGFVFLGGPIDDEFGNLIAGNKIPEPGSIFLVLSALLAIGFASRLRQGSIARSIARD